MTEVSTDQQYYVSHNKCYDQVGSRKSAPPPNPVFYCMLYINILVLAFGGLEQRFSNME